MAAPAYCGAKGARSKRDVPISINGDETTALLTADRLRPLTSRLHHRRPLRHSRLHPRTLEDDSSELGKKRSFCKTWCEMWFILAKSRVTCIIATLVLFTFGAGLILITSLGGVVHCPPLTGGVVFCILMAVLAISLALLCCCYHWVQEDEDLPFAIFCVGYCLLLLFIFTTITGTTVVFTHFDVIRNGSYWTEAGYVDCDMAGLPFGILLLSYVLGVFFCVVSYCACIVALGASSDV